MRRFLILIIVFGFTLSISAQNNLNVTILDKKNKEALPGCNVIVKKRGLGFATNALGQFSFGDLKISELDTLSVSFIGFETYECLVKDVKSRIYLREKPLQLAEVSVQASKFKLKKFMRAVLKKYKNKEQNKPHLAIAHYREKAKKNGKYIMYAESRGYSIYSGKVALASSLANYKFVCDITRLCNTNKEWDYHKSNRSKDAEKVGLGCGNNLNVLRFFEVYGILKPANLNNYSFKIDSSYLKGQEEYLIVAFHGKDTDGKFVINRQREEIDSLFCLTDKYFSNAFHKRVKANLSLNFTYYNNRAFVNSIHASFNKDGLEYINDFNVLVQKFINFQLTAKEFWEIDGFDKQPYVVYNKRDWDQFNIEKDKNYKQICSDLGFSEMEMEDVYRSNSGKWYSDSPYQPVLVLKIIESLKSRF